MNLNILMEKPFETYIDEAGWIVFEIEKNSLTYVYRYVRLKTEEGYPCYEIWMKDIFMFNHWNYVGIFGTEQKVMEFMFQ